MGAESAAMSMVALEGGVITDGMVAVEHLDGPKFVCH
jgi:hypothetical protein